MLKFHFISVQEHISHLRRKGYAASTCNHPIRVLRHAMALACTWKIIDSNQLAGLSLLGEENHVNNIMTNDELERLIKVLKSDKKNGLFSVSVSAFNRVSPQ